MGYARHWVAAHHGIGAASLCSSAAQPDISQAQGAMSPHDALDMSANVGHEQGLST